jgi:hypothetical protein
VKVFVALFAINVCVAIVLWFNMRQVAHPEVFVFESRAKDVQLLSPASSASNRSCILLGPFDVVEDGLAIHDDLLGQGYKVDLVAQELEQAPGYWVYFGPMDTYADALVQLREFQAKNIDSFIITRDDLYGAISLGVFENIDSAQRMQLLMAKRSYPTTIRNIFKFKTVNWVQVEHAESELKFIKNSGLAVSYEGDLKMREIFCKTVASRKPLP